MTATEGSSTEICALHFTSFGNMPLIVLSAGRWEPDLAYSSAENLRIRATIEGIQSKLAALSSEGKQIIAEQSGHNIQLDQPDHVISAIQK